MINLNGNDRQGFDKRLFDYNSSGIETAVQNIFLAFFTFVLYRRSISIIFIKDNTAE